MRHEFEVTHIGALGDGVGFVDGEEVYIPYTLPGEVVRAERSNAWARLEKILAPSDSRIEPLCEHFSRCGGCKLQHMPVDDYFSWKTERICQELVKRGIDAELHPIWSAGLGQRRRAQFSASRTKKLIRFGFHQYRGTEIENVEQCPVLVSAIHSKLDELRRLISHFLTRKKQAKISVTACLDGLDLKIDGARRELAPDIIRRILPDCNKAHVQRLVVDGELLLQRSAPEVDISGVRIPLPSGAFLQACKNAEDHMSGIIRKAFKGCRKAADLFSGVGTFSFALAEHVRMLAVENSAGSLEALATASDRADRLKPITVLGRDLMQDPLTAVELDKFDGVIFDPPRAGAIAQAAQIARSKVPLVAAVSCNPNTLAGDLKVLMEGGYIVRSIHPIDQFVYSSHVEVIAILARD